MLLAFSNACQAMEKSQSLRDAKEIGFGAQAVIFLYNEGDKNGKVVPITMGKVVAKQFWSADEDEDEDDYEKWYKKERAIYDKLLGNTTGVTTQNTKNTNERR
jgi:hypothetical protein